MYVEICEYVKCKYKLNIKFAEKYVNITWKKLCSIHILIYYIIS